MTDRGQGMTAKQLLKVFKTSNPYGPGAPWFKQKFIDTSEPPLEFGDSPFDVPPGDIPLEPWRLPLSPTTPCPAPDIHRPDTDIVREVDLEKQRHQLIDEFEEFLNKTSSDVPGRDELRDKVRDYKKDYRKHIGTIC